MDKDWYAVCSMIFTLVTSFAAKGSEQAHLYDKNEFKEMCMPITQDKSNAFSAVLGKDDEEMSVLEDIFGTKSTVRYEVFVEATSKHAKWIFSAPLIREKIFK